MFVKKVFQLVKPFLAILHSTCSNNYSYMYSMTAKKFCSFLANGYSKYAEFYADFKSVELIGKMSTQKKFSPNTFASYQYRRGETKIFHTFFGCNFFVSIFLHFSQQFRNQHKILRCFDTHIQILQRQSFYVILALF